MKGLVVTLVGLVLGVAGIGVAVWVWLAPHTTDSPTTEDRTRVAGVGTQVLPARVPAGPDKLQAHDGSALSVPERRDVFGVPRISGSLQRRWCEGGSCQYDLAFDVADYHGTDDRYRSNASMYVARVFPEPADRLGTVTASSLSESGDGGIVVDAPFKNGWICYRMTVAFSDTTDADPVARTPWSTAACFLLDDQGYVIRGEDRL